MIETDSFYHCALCSLSTDILTYQVLPFLTAESQWALANTCDNLYQRIYVPHLWQQIRFDLHALTTFGNYTDDMMNHMFNKWMQDMYHTGCQSVVSDIHLIREKGDGGNCAHANKNTSTISHFLDNVQRYDMLFYYLRRFYMTHPHVRIHLCGHWPACDVMSLLNKIGAVRTLVIHDATYSFVHQQSAHGAILRSSSSLDTPITRRTTGTTIMFAKNRHNPSLHKNSFPNKSPVTTALPSIISPAKASSPWAFRLDELHLYGGDENHRFNFFLLELATRSAVPWCCVSIFAKRFSVTALLYGLFSLGYLNVAAPYTLSKCHITVYSQAMYNADDSIVPVLRGVRSPDTPLAASFPTICLEPIAPKEEDAASFGWICNCHTKHGMHVINNVQTIHDDRDRTMMHMLGISEKLWHEVDTLLQGKYIQ